MPEGLYVADKVLAEDLCCCGETALTYTIHYPLFSGAPRLAALPAINALYKKDALTRARMIRTEGCALASADLLERRRDGFPFVPYETLQTFDATYAAGCIVSLYFDNYAYTGGAHGDTIRAGDTWNARTGDRVPLSALFPEDIAYRDMLLNIISARIAKAGEQGGYFDNSAALAREAFDERNFYLTPEGIVIFYQQYEIAPYSTGIPEFLIPYQTVGASVPRC